MNQKLVSVISCVRNEIHSLRELHARLSEATGSLGSAYDVEFIWVDDGSLDGSLEHMLEIMREDPRLRVVELDGPHGEALPLQAGLDDARGEILITLDADLEHFPEDLPFFVRTLEEGYDLVCG